MAGPLSRKYLAAEKRLLLIRTRVVGTFQCQRFRGQKKDDSSTFISHMIYKTPFQFIVKKNSLALVEESSFSSTNARLFFHNELEGSFKNHM